MNLAKNLGMLLFLVIAFLTFSISNVFAAETDHVFSDNFSSDFSQWDSWTDLTSELVIDNGAASMRNSQLTTKSIFFPTRIEFDVGKIESDGVPVFYIYPYYIDDNNALYLEKYDSWKWNLKKVVNGVTTTLATSSVHQLGDSMEHFIITNNNGLITVTANGGQLLQATDIDNSFAYGKFKLASWSFGDWGHFHVDNISIYDQFFAFVAEPTPANRSVAQNWVPVYVNLSRNGDSVNLEFDGVNFSMEGAGLNWFLNKTNVNDGNHTFRVFANASDGSKNVSGSKWIYADVTPPANVDSLAESAKGTTWVLWNWTNPADADFSHVEVQINNSFKANITSNSYNATGLEQNSGYVIQIRTVDNLGNAGSETTDAASTLADTTAPVLLFVASTPNNETKSQTWVYLNVTLGENGSSANLEWGGANETMSGSGTNFYLNKTNLLDGNYTFRVYSNDTAGNLGKSEERWVAIDTTPPAITSPTPSNNSALGAGTTSALLQVQTDETAQCKFLNLSGQSFANMGLLNYSNTTLHNTTIYNLSNGQTYDYYIKCSDTVGNLNSADYWLRFSVSNPAAPPGGGNPSGGGGGGGGGSTLSTTEKKEEKKKEIPKPTPEVVQTTPIEAKSEEAPEVKENIDIPITPTGLSIFDRIKNPYAAALIGGIMLTGLLGYNFYSGKIRPSKIEKLKFDFFQKLKSIKLGSFLHSKVTTQKSGNKAIPELQEMHIKIKELEHKLDTKLTPKPLQLSGRSLDILRALDERDQQIINCLVRNSGSATQAKVHHTTNVPRSTLSKRIAVLQQKNIVMQTERGKMRDLRLTDWFLSKKA